MRERFIIFVTNSLWDEPHRGRHHYANLLADDNTVLWVNRRLPRNSDSGKMGLEHRERGLHVLHTGRSPLPKRVDHILNWNNRVRLNMLSGALAEIGRDPEVLWVYDYRALAFARRYRQSCRTLYFCNDYFGESAYRRYESRLSTAVDCVLCTAPKLQERLKVFNSNCHFVPHGVWLPEQVPEFNKKPAAETAGYVGTYRQVIDAAFFRRVLENTDMRLILGGPVTECTPGYREEFERIFAHPRSNYLGNLDRQQAAQALAETDICLLPYICSRETEHQFTIKYFEYLAAGKPIVATPYFEWPEPYGRFVRICGEGGSLRDIFEDVYAHWNREHYDAARALAADSTWHKRVEQVSRIIGVG